LSGHDKSTFGKHHVKSRRQLVKISTEVNAANRETETRGSLASLVKA
jgi:hypothetical protein